MKKELMKKETILKLIPGALLFVVALMFGVTSGVAMAMSTPLEGGGVVAAQGEGAAGVLTVEKGEEASPDLYLSDVDEAITRIRPQDVILDTISRYARKVTPDSQEYRHYSLATRPIKTTLKVAITKQVAGKVVELSANDTKMFDTDDTIQVVGVKGFVKGDEDVLSDDDLVLTVAGKGESTGIPTVFAVNGLVDGDGQYTYIPNIPVGTVLIRMGKACSELSAQTSKFANLPTVQTRYCQNFMVQIEESTFNKMTKKEVGFSFSDLEEDSVFDMKMGQELSYLNGAQAKLTHPLKAEQVYFTGGILNQAGKYIEIGTCDSTTGISTITDDEMVDVSRELFTGMGAGGKKKVLLCGAEMLAALAKIKSERFKIRDSVDMWRLSFKSFDSNFGEMLAIHYAIFDEMNMSNYAFSLDPTLLTKMEFLTMKRSALDLKEAGVRNSDAVILQEVSGVYLRCPNAHALIKLIKE